MPALGDPHLLEHGFSQPLHEWHRPPTLKIIQSHERFQKRLLHHIGRVQTLRYSRIEPRLDDAS
jgi:hypothetical protein